MFQKVAITAQSRRGRLEFFFFRYLFGVRYILIIYFEDFFHTELPYCNLIDLAGLLETGVEPQFPAETTITVLGVLTRGIVNWIGDFDPSLTRIGAALPYFM